MKAIDVMGFAGSFAAGVDQAGFEIIGKREPAEFKGFGVESMVYNMPWLRPEAQVATHDQWDLPSEPVELVYGCPPCSGFSQLSYANKAIHGTTVGPMADINECMQWLVGYAARVKPRVVILESVGVAFKNGRDWMEGLWAKLVEESGVDYMLTHVNMNASWVGGDVVRPRYFLVAHQDPFGVGLDFVRPRTIREVLADLGPEEDFADPDWGHSTQQTNGVQRLARTIKWLREEHGREWAQGTTMPPNVEGLEPPDFWLRPDGKSSPRNPDPTRPVYSHWFSTDPFATRRWVADKPYGVVVAAVLSRAVHPLHDRAFTFREAARFMSIPDDWSLRRLVETNSGDELGKAVPTASGKWIAHWARQSILGEPGEFAGVADTDDDRIRVINVQKEKDIIALRQSPPPGTMYEGQVASSDPSTWLVDRKQRPVTWWQREQEAEERVSQAGDLEVVARTREPRKRRVKTTPVPRAAVQRPSGGIVRVPPEEVQAFLDGLGLSRAEAAAKLGVSPSRVYELTTHVRPKSWLNAARWPDVQETLRG